MALDRKISGDLDVVLVHGTWAEKAPWSNDEHGAIRSAMRARLQHENLYFHPLNWSGSNKHSSRIEAGEKLATLLETLVQKENSKCIVIGHSHGGAVINHALRLSGNLSTKLFGLVYLSTPFVQVRERIESKHIKTFMHALLWMVCVLVCILPALLLGVLFIHLPTALLGLIYLPLMYVSPYVTSMIWHLPPEQGWWQKIKVDAAAVAPFFAMVATAFVVKEMLISIGLIALLSWGAAILAAVVVLFLVFLFFSPSNQQDIEHGLPRIDVGVKRLQDQFSTESIGNTACCFIRSNRDEAAAGLGMVYIFSRLINTLVTGAIFFLSFFFSIWDVAKWKNYRTLWSPLSATTKWTAGLLVIFVAIPFVLAMLLFLIFVVLYAGLASVGLDADYSLKSIHAAIGNVLSYPIFTFSTEFIGKLQQLLLILLITSGLVIAIAAIGLLVLGRAFGHWFVWTSLILEVFIEPVPPGTWNLTQLSDQSDLHFDSSPGMEPLAHSMSYQDPKAINALISWLQDRIHA